MSPENPTFKIRKKTLGSYPYISVVLSITLALVVIGVFGLLLIYSNELERTVQENVKIQVYLKNNLTESQRLQIEKTLASQPFIPASKIGTSIEYISKEQAAKSFIKETGEEFQSFLGENPLRDAFLVNVDPAFQDKSNLTKIKTRLEHISGVFQVQFSENLIESINKNITKIGLVSAGLAMLLLLTVVLLINNTLRLALFSQRFLIRSMQLVGARRWFIQRPFLFRAAFHGTLAGFIASGLLIALISFANKHIDDLILIQNNRHILALFGMLVLVGIFVAVFSTFRSISKYLKLSLDELY
jgi:cell division transport system permease protein